MPVEAKMKKKRVILREKVWVERNLGIFSGIWDFKQRKYKIRSGSLTWIRSGGLYRRPSQEAFTNAWDYVASRPSDGRNDYFGRFFFFSEMTVCSLTHVPSQFSSFLAAICFAVLLFFHLLLFPTFFFSPVFKSETPAIFGTIVCFSAVEPCRVMHEQNKKRLQVWTIPSPKLYFYNKSIAFGIGHVQGPV